MFAGYVCHFLQFIDMIPKPLEIIFGGPLKRLDFLHMSLTQRLELSQFQLEPLKVHKNRCINVAR